MDDIIAIYEMQQDYKTVYNEFKKDEFATMRKK